MTHTCPDEDTLSSIAAGESLPPEVMDHTSSCADCKSRLASYEAGLSTLQNLWAAQRTVTTSPAATARPMEIGKYLIIGTLGEGAQAVVYRGLHPALGREVVLKIGKHVAAPSADAKAGLVNEGKVLSLLDHPGIARVLDLDFHDGKPCLVMEHVAGIDLEKYARDGITPERAAEVVAHVARAAASAHAQGVVHHDIKPTNILVRDDDGTPVLIDFGLAWLKKAGGDPHAPGGTLAYMAPEQARGEADKVGPASDVFALGAVLFHLLTGEPPFRGSSPGEVMRKAMACDISRDLLDRSAAPARLKKLCLWAMSPRPQDRPASAAAFADELERRPVSYRRWLLAAGVALAACFAVLAAAWLWPRPLPQARGTQVMVRLMEPADGDLKRPSLKNGDKVQVQFEIPAGSEVALYWLDTEGKLQSVPTAPSPAAPAQVRAPANGTHAAIEGPPGTELVLAVCSRKGRALPDTATVRKILDEANGGPGAWPALPAEALRQQMSPAGVDSEGAPRGMGRSAATAFTEVRTRLERLRELLRPHCDWAWAAAVPHG